MRTTVLSTIAFAFLALAASAEERRGPRPPELRVTGNATVPAAPDQAQVDVAVISQARTAAEAAAQNAAATEKVLGALRGTGAAVQTLGYGVRPDYRTPKPGGRPEIAGYTASNTVRATTDDLAEVGGLIDRATGAGASEIRGLRFMLKDEEPVRREALALAAVRARAKADAIAKALGTRVVGVRRVEEGGGSVPVARHRAMAMEASVATPVEAGDVEVRATVSLTVEIAP